MKTRYKILITISLLVPFLSFLPTSNSEECVRFANIFLTTVSGAYNSNRNLQVATEAGKMMDAGDAFFTKDAFKLFFPEQAEEDIQFNTSVFVYELGINNEGNQELKFSNPVFCREFNDEGSTLYEVAVEVQTKKRSGTTIGNLKLIFVEDLGSQNGLKIRLVDNNHNLCANNNSLLLFNKCEKTIVNAELSRNAGKYEEAITILGNLTDCPDSFDEKKESLRQLCNERLSEQKRIDKERKLKEEERKREEEEERKLAKQIAEMEEAKRKQEEDIKRLEEEKKLRELLKQIKIAEQYDLKGDSLFVLGNYEKSKGAYKNSISKMPTSKKYEYKFYSLREKILNCDNCIGASEYISKGDAALSKGYIIPAHDNYDKAYTKCQSQSIELKLRTVKDNICGQYMREAENLFQERAYNDAKSLIEQVYIFDRNYEGARDLEIKCSRHLSPEGIKNEIARVKRLFMETKSTKDYYEAYTVLYNNRNSIHMDGDAYFILGMIEYQPKRYGVLKYSKRSVQQIHNPWKVHLGKANRICKTSRCMPDVFPTIQAFKDEGVNLDKY